MVSYGLVLLLGSIEVSKFFSSLIAGPQPAVHCGHLVAQARGEVKAFGESIGMFTMPKAPGAWFLYCHDCIGAMSIRCAWCGKPICIGNMVTLYLLTGRDRDKKIPGHAVVLNAKDRSLVGCARTDCAESGADYAGVWVPLNEQRGGQWIGGVRPFKSPIQMVIDSGRAVVVNDIEKHARETAADHVLSPARMARVA